MATLTSARLADLKARVANGDVDAAREVIVYVEVLERAEAVAQRARRDLAAEQAAELEIRLAHVAKHGGECASCDHAEARAVLAQLRKIAGA
jgi:CRISPR/Cas system-associated exonuclease Cas4 (RecB family)